jgi:tRNA G18 (ribose-2'-O)-methylase SpoU
MAVPFVPWEYHEDAVALVRRLKQDGKQIVAVEQAHGSVSYASEGVYRQPLCLVLGHERAGVTPPVLALADLCVEIPVYGMANSLNVAMSLSIVGFEILRQHHAFGARPL